MAAQDVGEIVPRLRRAVEGPVEQTGPGALTSDQLTAMAADAIADIILNTAGAWSHTLQVSSRDDDTNVPTGWVVDPELSLEEESVVAAQAALTYFFHQFKEAKVSERMQNEGQSWEYQVSSTMLRDWLKLLQEQRDAALAALTRANPVLARYASLLQVRDRLAAAQIEPWTSPGGIGGGMLLVG